MPTVESPHASLRVPDEHVDVQNRFEFDWTYRPMTYLAPNFGVDRRLMLYFPVLRSLAEQITREHKAPVIVFEAIPGCDKMGSTFANIIVRWQSERGTFLQHYVPCEVTSGNYKLHPSISGATMLVPEKRCPKRSSVLEYRTFLQERLTRESLCALVATLLAHGKKFIASIFASCFIGLIVTALGVIMLDIVASLLGFAPIDYTTQNMILGISCLGYLVTMTLRDYGVVWLPPVKEFFFWLLGERA